MTTDFVIADPWLEFIEHRAIDVIAGTLKQGVHFLEQARRPNAGWGSFVGVETDRHASALAMQALRLAASDDAAWIVEEGSAHFLELYRKQVRGLGAEALIDVISLLGDRLDGDASLRNDLSKRATTMLDALLSEASTSLTSLARLLLVGARRGVLAPAAVQNGCDRLWNSRNNTGTWGATPNATASLLPTATATRALSRCADPARQPELDAAYSYLERELVAGVEAQNSIDPYIGGMGLRALGERDVTPYSVLAVMIDYLAETQNTDGGWSARPHTPSTIEHTAMVVISLVAAGERRLVPYRLVS